MIAPLFLFAIATALCAVVHYDLMVRPRKKRAARRLLEQQRGGQISLLPGIPNP